MAYYNITINVDENNKFQNNFLELLRHMSEAKTPLSIKPVKTKIFTSDCLFFDDVDSETYKEISKVADDNSALEMHVKTVQKLDTYTNDVRNLITNTNNELFNGILKLMTDEVTPATPDRTITVNVPDPVKEVQNEQIIQDATKEDFKEPPVEQPDDTTTTETEDYEETNDDTTPEKSNADFEDDLDMDDSEPDEEPDSKDSIVPNGKLYDDTYEILMTYKTFNSKNASQQEDIIHSEVGIHEYFGSLDSRKYWKLKPHHTFDSYTEKYPEMINVDEPNFWLKSYTNYVRHENIYKNEGNNEDGFYNFDSFIRAKLNRDLISEDKVRIRINKLYE